MKFKITNKKKFIKFIMLLFIFIITTICFISSKTLSYGEIQYQTIYAITGDTLWDIARAEKTNNPYFANKKIPQIIEEIKEINHLNGGILKIGEEIKIPYIQ